MFRDFQLQNTDFYGQNNENSFEFILKLTEWIVLLGNHIF